MKKKILFVTNHFRFSNGVATVLRNLIANLNQNKYEIDLLAIYEFNKEFAEPIKDKITVIPGFNCYFRGFDKIINLISPKLLYKKFVKKQYDLEIAFQYGIPTKIIGVSKNKNKICWMHTFDSEMKLLKYYKMFPKIVNVAKIGSEKLISHGFSRDQVSYCYNIIDEETINSKSEELCNFAKKKSICIATLARLAPDKAFMRYLAAINNVKESISHLEFLIIGSGSEEEKMRSFIDSNNLNPVVHMVGLQKNPYPFLKASDLYFCCSYREGFSTACQEAAILGIPVVSVDVDGANELYEISESGRVIPNNQKSIEDFLIWLENNLDIVDKWRVVSQSNKLRFSKNKRVLDAEALLDESIK